MSRTITLALALLAGHVTPRGGANVQLAAPSAGMVDVQLCRILEGQDDIVAWWQLRSIGWERDRINAHVWRQQWREIHRGVWAAHRGEITQRHLWIAAVLTAPNRYLFADSACARHGFAEWIGEYETVVCAGSGGRRRFGSLVVARSTALAGQTTRVEGIPAVSAPLALISVAPHWDKWQLGRGFRESIRVKATTADEIAKALAGQRGTAVLADRCDRYATIPYHRCRSDAESRGLEVLHDAGIEPPQVNVSVAGARPDFTWRRRRLIIEIDGPQYHLFAEEDAHKQARWEAAGYTVRRLPSDDVYFRPERLLALTQPNVQLAA